MTATKKPKATKRQQKEELKAGNAEAPAKPRKKKAVPVPLADPQDAITELVRNHGANFINMPEADDWLKKAGVTRNQCSEARIAQGDRTVRQELNGKFKADNADPKKPLKTVVVDDPEFDPAAQHGSTTPLNLTYEQLVSRHKDGAKMKQAEATRKADAEQKKRSRLENLRNRDGQEDDENDNMMVQFKLGGSTMQVSANEARKMLIEKGFKNAADFNEKKLSAYLNELETRSEGADEPTTAECVALQKNILAALKEGEEIVVMATKTKATKKASTNGKASPKATNGKKPSSREVDKFGYGVTTSASKINQILSKTPMSTKDIADKAKTSPSRVSAHLYSLMKKNLVVKTDDGYKVAAK